MSSFSPPEKIFGSPSFCCSRMVQLKRAARADKTRQGGAAAASLMAVQVASFCRVGGGR